MYKLMDWQKDSLPKGKTLDYILIKNPVGGIPE